MKVIEKVNQYGDTQIFEILTSRKELAEWLKGVLWDSLYSAYKNSIFNDPDTVISYYDKDGVFYWIAEGEEVKKPNVAKITRYLETNAGTNVIYGDVSIEYNEHYGDWEASMD